MDTPEQLLAQELLKYEGKRLRPYLCSAGVPTVGVGATTYPDGRKVTLNDPPITDEQCDEMLRLECIRYLTSVQRMLKPTVHTSTNQLVAMTSLAYNIGLDGFRKSTVLRAHNAGNFEAAARAFTLWNKARVNGTLQEVRGLTSRRLSESALYLTPEYDGFETRGVQAVNPESSLARSPMNLAGMAGVTTGSASVVAAGLGDALPVVHQVREWADTLSINPVFVFALIVVVIGGVVMHYRYKQRSEGWA